MTFTEEITWRGFVNQTTYKDINVLNSGAVTFYFGVDPSADSMTVGNLAASMLVKCFIKYGHKPVLLVGGATGLIGDPDGKADERQLIDQNTLNKNKLAIADQYKNLFNQDIDIVDNFDWFKDMGYLEFLRTVGKHVPMRQMLGREFVESRLAENGAGISYAEFSYVLIQAYDFVFLNKNYEVSLQLCGADQWGNSIAGVDLIRRISGKEANVFSTPLVVDDTTGKKFGKSEAGAIWLDPKKTSPTQFYQFWINLPDNSVEKYLKIFTELDKEEVDAILSDHNKSPGRRIGQKALAKAVTKLVHGEEATDMAEKLTDVLTGQIKLGNLAEPLINALAQELPTVNAKENSEISEALVASNLAPSKTEARKLLINNAISINGEKVAGEIFTAADFTNGCLLLRRGKAYKDSALVKLG
jgi:tyrosyl-tRNA synthetase